MYSICIPSIPFLSFFFLIVGSWLYNVVLVSAVQQCESAMSIHSLMAEVLPAVILRTIGLGQPQH